MNIEKKIDEYLNESVGKNEFVYVENFDSKNHDIVSFITSFDLKKKLRNYFDGDIDETARTILSMISKGKTPYLSFNQYYYDKDGTILPLIDDNIKDLEDQNINSAYND